VEGIGAALVFGARIAGHTAPAIASRVAFIAASAASSMRPQISAVPSPFEAPPISRSRRICSRMRTASGSWAAITALMRDSILGWDSRIHFTAFSASRSSTRARMSGVLDQLGARDDRGQHPVIQHAALAVLSTRGSRV
jgi:hypothetical protein